MAEGTAEGIAADFQDALDDLKSSDEYAIANLVVIARENIQFAESIARVVANHIGKTRPDWKLPAMYVLDAISKRVGSPYTIYFQRNLFKTFMNAYSAMDPANRRAMDALLQTWKQPVPGSRDPTPVYPPHVTQEIERPLMQWRTAALQHQQPPRHASGYVPQFAPGDPRAARFGRTPPPANARPPSAADRASAPPQVYQHTNGQYGALPARGQPYSQTPPPNPAQYQPPTPQYGQPAPHIQPAPVATYHYHQSAVGPTDHTFQSPLPYSPPIVLPQTGTPQPPYQPAVPPGGATPVPPPMDPEAAKALLAQLLGNLAPTPGTVSTPPPPPAQPAISGLPPIYPPLTNLNLPVSTAAHQTPPIIPANLARHSPAPLSHNYPDLRNPSSLRTPHPDLIKRLFQPDQCKQCGMRFPATPTGKAKKQKHLDWHFRNNTRIAEAQKQWKLTQRSWFVDEKEWIGYREDPYGASEDLESSSPGSGGKAGADGAGRKGARKEEEEEHVVPVPLGAGGPDGGKCPICQEKFESRWDRARDTPVWVDALEVKGLGNGVAHWSCYQEAYGKNARATPEVGVLGKRKVRD